MPKLIPAGPDRVKRVGILTGAGGSMIEEASAAGLDTLVTGEGAHHTFFDAEELGMNVYYGGHYLTETFGVKALAEHIADDILLRKAPLSADEDLFAAGFDSMSLSRVLVFVEERFGVTIPDQDVVLDEVSTLRTMAAFVKTYVDRVGR